MVMINDRRCTNEKLYLLLLGEGLFEKYAGSVIGKNGGDGILGRISEE